MITLADHGEHFGEQGRMSHGRAGSEKLLHIPIFIRFPASAALPPAQIDARVDLRDIKPTLLESLRALCYVE